MFDEQTLPYISAFVKGMNIGIDIRSLMTSERTGVAEYTFELLNALFAEQSEHQFFLFYNAHKDLDAHIPEWKLDNVHVIKKQWPNKVLNASMRLFGWPKIDELIQKESGIEKLDYFFSPNLNFIALSDKTKHILTIHDLSFELFPDCYSKKRQWWHRFIEPKKKCEEASMILCPSENTKQDVVRLYGVDESKVHTIYPGLSSEFHKTGVSQEDVRAKYNLPKHFILFLGTLEPRKNIVGSIDAFLSREKVVDVGYEFIIAGPKGWHYEEILSKIDEAKQVRYIGYVDAAEKKALYELADLFVFPSLYEGFGFPVLEALAAGTPVVTSNRSSLPEVAKDAAYLVDPTDIHDIGLGIERMLDEERLCERMKQRSAWQAEMYTWKQAAETFLKLL